MVAQNRKYFWNPEGDQRRTIRPDIRITQGEKTFVFDTKWKILQDNGPSVEDLRQMYTYHHYFHSNKVALVYPGDFDTVSGKFADIDRPNSDSNLECSLIFIPVGFDVKKWQIEIAEKVVGWVESQGVLSI